MNNSGAQNITQLLNRLTSGGHSDIDKILPLVYDELRKISSKYLNDEYRHHTLQTTELVHEAYIKLIGSRNISWENRSHFFSIAARSMRQILVDYARKRKSQKRGSGRTNLSLDEIPQLSSNSDEKIIALDDALNKMEELDERACRIVELRYFSGLTIEETAELLNISPATVKRDWNFAKAWLYREIK